MALPRAVLDDLKRSGLTPADASKMKVEFLPSRPPTIPYRAYRLPYFYPSGQANGFERLKLLDPYTPAGGKKAAKYLQKPGTEARFYFSPMVEWKKILTDASRPLWITEGEKKAALLCKLGIPCVGIGGVWNWRKKVDDDSSDPIDDFRLIEWRRRYVYLCFDSDYADRGLVRLALEALKEELVTRHARPFFVRLPSQLDEGKAAIDDYLAPLTEKKRAAALEELVAKAEPLYLAPGLKVKELLAMKIKPRTWIVPDLLTAGLTILAGPSKIGKSWLALQLGMCAAAGRCRFLSMYQLGKPIGVAYLALEDTPERLQERVRKLAGHGVPTTGGERLDLHMRWDSPDAHGLDALRDYLEEHTECRLVMIDTLGRMRVTSDHRNRGYQQDYNEMIELKRIADERGVAVVLIHHTKKGEALDPMELISGTTGLLGGADAGFVLRRSRMSGKGELAIAGRDFHERAYAMELDDGVWHITGEAQTVKESEAQSAIAEALRTAEGPLTPTQIGQLTGRSRMAVFNVVKKMVETGVVLWEKGRYSLPLHKK